MVNHGRTTRVLIVRHGESTFNVQQRYQGRSDEPVLSERGVAAGMQVGRYLTLEPIDAVVSSPLRRAFATAEIIVAILREGDRDDLPLNTSDDLMEVDLPQWQGLALESVRRQFPESYRIWTDQPHEFRMSANGGPEFFPVRELFEQANRFWREFLRQHAGEAVVLVTHAGTARALISTAVGINPERFHCLQQSNGGISILEFLPGRSTARIEALNMTAHLGEHMPKLKRGRQGARIIMVASDSPRQQLAHNSGILNHLRVDFVFSADDRQSKKIGHALIEANPYARLVMFRSDAPFDSQNPESTPSAASIASSEHSLSTGVFVGRDAQLNTMLCALLGIGGRGSPWTHCANAVVHYPGTSKYPGTSRMPILQALNLPVRRDGFEPVTTEAQP